MIRRVKHIPQFSQVECGLCCCAMILRYFGSYNSLAEIRKNLEIGRDGLKVSDLAEYLKSRRMLVEVVRASELNKDQLFYEPIIAYLSKAHYVVVQKKKKDKVIVYDPNLGKNILSLEKFNKMFGGCYLVANPAMGFEKSKQKIGVVWREVGKMLSQRKATIALVIGSTIFSYFFIIGVPIFIQTLIDYIDKLEQSDILFLLLPLFGCFVAYLLVVFFRASQTLALNISFGWTLEAETYKHLIHAVYKYFETRSPGDLLYRLSICSSVKEILASNISGGIVNLGALVFILFFMFWQCWQLGLLSSFCGDFITNIHFVYASFK